MSLIRKTVGRLILLADSLFPPEQAASIQDFSRSLTLFQFEACPFCVKVRRAMRRLGIQAELRNALPGTSAAEELIREGGKLQTPCLRIKKDDGSFQWMYESSDIIQYLETLTPH
ncbi:MAG: glutathione S-transferase N-terminal domain-containing protein [Oligoflexia bacterium]|nr:glutathione S-transferase N-terminal domain-containing protein [Oligoflexia bacterium]